jgi:hypothetical protein
MTHAVAAWPPDRPGGVVVGKTTHVWYPRVSVAGPAISSCSVAVVACVGNPGSIWGNVRFHCAPVWYYSASHTHTHKCIGHTPAVHNSIFRHTHSHLTHNVNVKTTHAPQPSTPSPGVRNRPLNFLGTLPQFPTCRRTRSGTTTTYRHIPPRQSRAPTPEPHRHADQPG